MVFLVIVLATVLILLYKYLTYNFDYWTKRGVKGPKPIVLAGTFLDVFLFKRSLGQCVRKWYEQYPDEKFIGLFNGRKPVFTPRDLDIARQILIKDFNHFTDRGLGTSNDPLGENVFNVDGDSWKVLRQNLTPVFSSGKIKNMYYLIHNCGVHFQKYVAEIVDRNEVPEIRDLMGRFTLEVICSCAFGIEVDALKRGTNIFQDMGKKIFEPTWKQFSLSILEGIFPGILKLLNLSIAKPEVVNFFDDLVKKVLDEREGKPKVREDFMDLILALREKGSISGGKFRQDNDIHIDITDRMMAAQAFIFFAAGFETSSGAMSFLLYELALNQSIQDKLRNEINEISKKYEGITYEALHEMNYLEMAFSESLRKYPVGEVLIRKCVKDYNLPDTKIFINEGVFVFVPVMGFHRDPKYFPDPEIFDPERFSPGNKHGLPYMPFGDGPRNCIGLRFAKVQSMLGIALFLQKFRVLPSPKTETHLHFHPRTFTLSSSKGIWLDIEKV